MQAGGAASLSASVIAGMPGSAFTGTAAASAGGSASRPPGGAAVIGTVVLAGLGDRFSAWLPFPGE